MTEKVAATLMPECRNGDILIFDPLTSATCTRPLGTSLVCIQPGVTCLLWGTAGEASTSRCTVYAILWYCFFTSGWTVDGATSMHNLLRALYQTVIVYI